jgi:hypothetical protein
MLFAVSTVWREQKDHLTDCYFFLTKLDEYNSNSKYIIVHPNIPSALRLAEHDDSLQFSRHLNNGPCMKNNKPASLQKTNLDFHVPM